MGRVTASSATHQAAKRDDASLSTPAFTQTPEIAMLYSIITLAQRCVRVLHEESPQDAPVPQAVFARIGPAPLAALQRLSLAQLG